MQNLKAFSPDGATGKTKEVFAALEENQGSGPNVRRTLPDSPEGLKADMNNSSAKTSDSRFPAGRSTSRCLP